MSHIGRGLAAPRTPREYRVRCASGRSPSVRRNHPWRGPGTYARVRGRRGHHHGRPAEAAPQAHPSRRMLSSRRGTSRDRPISSVSQKEKRSGWGGATTCGAVDVDVVAGVRKTDDEALGSKKSAHSPPPAEISHPPVDAGENRPTLKRRMRDGLTHIITQQSAGKPLLPNTGSGRPVQAITG